MIKITKFKLFCFYITKPILFIELWLLIQKEKLKRKEAFVDNHHDMAYYLFFEDTGLRRSADQATRAACDMRTIIRRHNLEMELTVETRKWIERHDKADAKRIAEENAAGIRQRVKQNALDKLTLEERRVLGL